MKLLLAATLCSTVLGSGHVFSPYDVVDQAPVFAKMHGYWSGEGEFQYALDFQDELNDPGSKYAYMNVTIEGDRFYDHRYMVWPQWSHAVAGDTYAITSANDNDLHLVGDSYDLYPVDQVSFRIRAVDEDTIIVTSRGQPMHTSTFVFIDDNTMRGITEIVDVDEDDITGEKTIETRFRASYTYRRVATAQDWMDEVQGMMDQASIRESLRVDFPSGCLDQRTCVTEEQWAQADPKLTEDIEEEEEPEEELLAETMNGDAISISDPFVISTIALGALVALMGMAIVVLVKKNNAYARGAIRDDDTAKLDLED